MTITLVMQFVVHPGGGRIVVVPGTGPRVVSVTIPGQLVKVLIVT